MSEFNWSEMSKRKIELDKILNSDIFSHWGEMTTEEHLPTMIRCLLKKELDVFLLFIDNELVYEEHRYALEQIAEKNLHVFGTMDASKDDKFRSLYLEHGWRTVIYVRLNIQHQVIPDTDARLLGTMMISVPCLFVSKLPDVVTEEEFEESNHILNLALSAMLLRIGLTFFGSRTLHLWNSIPGALLLVSPESIYRANDEAYEWAGIDFVDERNRKMLADFFSSEICRWVFDCIHNNSSEDDRRRVFWINRNKGERVRAHITLIPYRPWEKIRVNDRMASGFDGISMKDINRMLYLMLIQDTTREWEAETLEHQMSLARRMQQNLLPDILPDLPGLDVTAFCQPASNVGGDLYDVIKLDDGRVAVLIGDATGHGVDSALLAAVASGAFRAAVRHSPEPAEVLKSVDDVLRSTNQSGFVTVVYMLINKDRTRMDVGLAGHYPPVICRCDKKKVKASIFECEFETPSSLPLGVNLEPIYHLVSYDLQVGDIVAAFSDGILEFQLPGGDFFQKEIPGLIVSTTAKSASEIWTGIFNSLTKKTAEKPPEDDLTAVIFKIV